MTRAGLNFADTHTRTNSYVQKATLPLVPGGEVAGALEEHAASVWSALVRRPAATPSTPCAPRERIFPIPDGIDDGTALALVIQGTTAWHLLRTAGTLAPRARASSCTRPPAASARWRRSSPSPSAPDA